MKSWPTSLLLKPILTQVKHCHIFMTDKQKSGMIDRIFFDVKQGIVAYCDLSYSMYGAPEGISRLQTEKDMYKFILHPDSLDKVVTRENEKTLLCFKMCYECNMASLN